MAFKIDDTIILVNKYKSTSLFNSQRDESMNGNHYRIIPLIGNVFVQRETSFGK
jgi:hypothetical protein